MKTFQQVQQKGYFDVISYKKWQFSKKGQTDVILSLQCIFTLHTAEPLLTQVCAHLQPVTLGSEDPAVGETSLHLILKKYNY